MTKKMQWNPLEHQILEVMLVRTDFRGEKKRLISQLKKKTLADLASIVCAPLPPKKRRQKESETVVLLHTKPENVQFNTLKI